MATVHRLIWLKEWRLGPAQRSVPDRVAGFTASDREGMSNLFGVRPNLARRLRTDARPRRSAAKEDRYVADRGLAACLLGHSVDRRGYPLIFLSHAMTGVWVSSLQTLESWGIGRMKHVSDLSGAEILSADERAGRTGASQTDGRHEQAMAGIKAAQQALAAGKTVDLVEVHRAYQAAYGNKA